MKNIIKIIILIFLAYFPIKTEETYEFIIKVKDPDKFDKWISQNQSYHQITKKFINLKAIKENNQINNSNYHLNQLNNYYIIKLNENNLLYYINKLRYNNNVNFITPNYKYKLDYSPSINDEKLSFQWALEQVRAFDAWKYASGKEIIIGIIDTGIDFNHPDLQNNLWINQREDLNKNGKFEPWPSTEFRNGIYGDLNGIDDDGNGFVDDVIGYDFVDQKIPNIGDWNKHDPIPFDEYDHGTSVAGVIAAEQNNSIGISGLAYNAKILSCRVFDITGNATASDIASAIIYATLNGAKILNFSFGEEHSSPLMHDAIKFAFSHGVIMVASAGNDGKDAPHYPSDYPEVISVGGSEKNFKRWIYSNFGSNLCLLAPAQNIITTTPNKSYSLKSGTSLSAPYVSAAVALLLEINPNLDFHDIKSILSTTAHNIDPDGWNYFTGAGILDIANACENVHHGRMSIDNPKFYEAFNKNKIKNIPIIGSIHTPLFDRYSILIGKGNNPQVWDTISSNINSAKINETLANIDISILDDTLYTISVLITLKNQKKLQLQTKFIVYSHKNPLRINNLTYRETLFNDKNVLSVSFNTSLNAVSVLKYRKVGTSDAFMLLTENKELSNNHFYILDNIEPDVLYEATIVAYLEGKDTVEHNFSFKIKDIKFPKYTFERKNYTLPRALIFPTVYEINKNNKTYVFFNDISSLSIRNSYAAEFDNGKFNIVDSLKELGIVTGLGDYNGNKKLDILLYGNGNTFILEKPDAPNKIYGNKIFDSQSNNFWAEHFYDLDNDGKDEIIAHNDTCFFVYSFINGKNILLAQTQIPSSLRNIGVWRGSVLGDFNNNGKIDLYHSNNKGHSFIFEFEGNKFKLIYIDTSISSAENQYITKADIDGDGIYEVIHSSYRITPRRNDPSDGLWYIRIIKFSQEKGFYVLDSLFVYGIRAGVIPRLGVSYRNGLAAGNLDNIKGEEIIISTMPNLYIFRWNSQTQKLEPLWYYPLAFTNSAYCYDFDKNGKMEIGFATFDKTEFWEFVGKPSIDEPSLYGYALDANTIKLFWTKVKNADKYNCYIYDENNQKLNFIGTYYDNYAIIQNLEENKYYTFVINAENALEQSRYSNSIRIFTNNLSQAVYFEATNQTTLIVHYNLSLKQGRIEPTKFTFKNIETTDIYTISSAQAVANKVYLTLNKKLVNGEYQLLCDDLLDMYDNPTKKNELSGKIIFDNTNLTPLIYLTNLTFLTNNYIQIEFSEPPDTSALNIDNYQITPYVKIIGVNKIPGDGRKFEVALSNEFPVKPKGQIYYLTAKNITTNDGKQITQGAGNTLAFVVNAKNLRQFYVFPHPISYQKDDYVTLAGLTAKAEIEIMTIDGEKLIILKENDANGGLRWDLKDKYGNKIKPGVYLIKVTNLDKPDVDFEMKKILVKP